MKKFIMFTLLAFAIGVFLSNKTLNIKIPELHSTTKLGFSVSSPPLLQSLDEIKTDAVSVKTVVQKYYESYEKSSTLSKEMFQLSSKQSNRPNQIYDNRITAKLGTPIRHAESGKIDLKLFRIKEPNYSGYALKVHIKKPSAMEMVLGKDTVGGSETTLQATNRLGAIAGVNGGGFADGGGKRYPLSNTVADGKLVYGFFGNEGKASDLTFIGFDKDRKLIGGKPRKEQDLNKLLPDFGASFVPTLLSNGSKENIPLKWRTSPLRAPRTTVGNFKDNQILFLVTDGYDEKGSSGATLTELQEKLKSLGVSDAFNLDGGGSSSLVFDGEIINHPSDEKLRALPTHFLFFK
jgi:exopolysaccharide biosynthesis protein